MQFSCFGTQLFATSAIKEAPLLTGRKERDVSAYVIGPSRLGRAALMCVSTLVALPSRSLPICETCGGGLCTCARTGLSRVSV
eukprot:scaffold37721_cov60-Phaeocystis_antarctica.AAC.2